SRRHTRFSRDWSSDVCSSDLLPDAGGARVVAGGVGVQRGLLAASLRSALGVAGADHDRDLVATAGHAREAGRERREATSVAGNRTEERRVGKERMSQGWTHAL